MAPGDIGDRESDFDLKKSSGYVIFQPVHQLMGKPDPRQQDLKPQRIFFYKRLTDDKILTFTEAEIARIVYSNPPSSHAFILRQIGVSDGSTYAKFIQNCGVKTGERVTLEKAQEILDGALEAEIAAATGNFAQPDPQNVFYDDSIRRHQNAKGIMGTIG